MNGPAFWPWRALRSDFNVMNQSDPNRGRNRREFMRDGMRYSLLAGMAAVSALLLKRSGGKLTGQTCVNQGICSGCGAYAGCGLPAALSAKAAKRGGLS
jgi:hypothetical protein